MFGSAVRQGSITSMGYWGRSSRRQGSERPRNEVVTRELSRELSVGSSESSQSAPSVFRSSAMRLIEVADRRTRGFEEQNSTGGMLSPKTSTEHHDA